MKCYPPKYEKNYGPEQTQTLLNQFVSAGLMFQEENRYIALAVHQKSRTTATEEL